MYETGDLVLFSVGVVRLIVQKSKIIDRFIFYKQLSCKNVKNHILEIIFGGEAKKSHAHHEPSKKWIVKDHDLVNILVIDVVLLVLTGCAVTTSSFQRDALLHSQNAPVWG